MSNRGVREYEGANSRNVQSQDEAFGKSLPLYRTAMTMFANAICDLNSSGSPRLEAMEWLVNGDNGLAQAKEFADWIARFHQASLSLDSELAQELAKTKVLVLEGGRVVTVADMTNTAETLNWLHEAAGIHQDSHCSPVLSNTAEGRVCRSRSAALMQSAYLGVSNSVRQHLDKRHENTPQANQHRSLSSNLPSLSA